MNREQAQRKIDSLKNASNNTMPGYLRLTDNNDVEVFGAYSKAVANDRAIAYNSSRTADFAGLTTYISGKPGLTGDDVEWFRPDQEPPRNSKQSIAFGRYSYRRIGLIRNAIDIMGDFTTQGVRISHPNKNIEKLCKAWWKMINGDSVSERFCNLMFREANVCIRIKTAMIDKQKKAEMLKALAEADIDLNSKTVFNKNEIPAHYVFIDPLLIDIVGGKLSSFIGNKNYRLTIPTSLRQEFSNIANSIDKQDKTFIKQIPTEILKAIKNYDSKGIALDVNKFRVYHYKKDDWQSWADPITASAYRDLRLYEKLKMTDDAALDGAVSKIRVWKLGNIDAKLYPTPEMSQALNDILSASVGGGVQDIIWGPDIELIETSTDIQQFLGEEKYKPTLMAIYACLGIPPTLTGTFGASGTTNNFISLKALTERLTYVRGVLMDFWDEQLKLFQEAMGFRYAPQLEFDFTNLDDPASIIQLLINLADRDIVSNEFVQRHIKAIPEIENERIKKERDTRDNGEMPEKASPYHQASQEFQLKKIALQTGNVTPSQVGVKLNPKKSGEKSALEMRQPASPGGSSSPSGPGSPGRPKNSNDTTKRKPKKFTPKQKAAIFAWVKSSQDKIASYFNPILLNGFNKKNMRSLSSKQYDVAEAIKFQVLCNIEYGEELNEESLMKAYQTRSNSIDLEFKQWLRDHEYLVGRQLKAEEIKDLQSMFYVNLYCGEL